MSYSLEEIADTLKSARQTKQLSQRALSDKVGLTQSHISQIENAAVDLKLSSLNELARALELELVLVPKKALPAVQSLVRTSRNSEEVVKAKSGAEARAIRRLRTAAKELHKLQPNLKVLREMQQVADAIERLKLPDGAIKQLQQIASQMNKYWKQSKALEPYTLDQATISSIRDLGSKLSELRNDTLHSSSLAITKEVRAKPAYQLTADEDDG